MDRLKILQIAIFIMAAVVTARLFYWQFVSKIYSGSTLGTSDSEIPAKRGEIYTSDNFPLVVNQQAFLIYGKPKEIKDPSEVSKIISSHLVSEKYATREAELSQEASKQKN